MVKNYPFVGSHYFSENFKPQDLSLTYQHIQATQTPHFYNEVEFIFIVSGKGEIAINGQLFAIKEGDLIHLLPYHVHQLILADNQSVECFRIRFSLGLLLLSSVNEDNYLSALTHMDYTVPIISLNARKQRQLRFFCDEVIYEKNQNNKHFETLHISLTSYISYLFQTIKMNPYHKNEPANGWRSLEYLQLYHQDELTVERVAHALALTTEEVRTSLNQLTGMDFIQLLNQVRIRNATALLQFPDLTIQKIASICGYASNANFYKQFKEVHDLTPTQYRQSLKENKQMIGFNDSWDVIIYILENCCTQLDLESVVTHTNFSSDKINKLLHDKLNIGFKELLNRCRVQVARMLVQNYDFNLSELAIKVGFSDVNTLIRNYKKYLNTTPHQDKKQSKWPL